MSQKKIILVGGGGHCKSCIEVIESTGLYSIEGVLDLSEKRNQKILNYTVIGTDEDIPRLAASGYSFLITSGHIKTSSIREKLFGAIKNAGGKCETVIANSARVSVYASIGEGTIIMHNAFVNANAKIGTNCIINTNAVIEHDVVIADHTHISTMAVVNGEVAIGSGTFVGSNSVVNQTVAIGNNIVIGSGTVVNKNITGEGIYAGNPFKKIS